MTTRRRVRYGMTLIELIVALTITGLIMTTGYAALSTLADRRRSASQSMNELERVAAVRATLSGWLAGAELTIEDDDVVFRGLDGTHEDSPDDELLFRTNARTSASVGSSSVRLFIERNDSTPQRGLVASIDVGRNGGRRLIELEPNATALDIRYLSGINGVPEWSSSWVSATVLPLGLELRLSSKSGDSLPPLLRLPLRVVLEAAR